MEENNHEVRETVHVTLSIDDTGHSMVNQYSIIKKLGQGTFGKVKLCQLDNKSFAVKIYNKSFLRRKKDLSAPSGFGFGNSALQAVFREIAIMKKFHHQNVLNLFEVIDDEDAEKIYIIMDYCEQGPIMEWDVSTRRFYFPWNNSGEITEEQLRKIFRDIVCGLEYLHFHNIVHRDIKPQNILLTKDWLIKIGDFGQAQIFQESDMQRSTIGTYYFFPPESCSSDTSEFSGKAADIWALGVTLYALVFKKLPFWADSLAGIFEVIQSFDLTFPAEVKVSDELQRLLIRLLDKNPETRIKMFELLQDHWLNQNCNPLLPSMHRNISVSDEEISQALKPLRALVYAVIVI